MIFLSNIETEIYWIYLSQPGLPCETCCDNVAKIKLKSLIPN